jgi:peroxiredoxin (alkyl hydroperoxide reductase subunit C)
LTKGFPAGERRSESRLQEEAGHEQRQLALKVGDRAPDFELPAVVGTERRTVRLADYRGKKHVVVTFHPLDWTPTCESQVPILNSLRERFAAQDAEVIDISVDSLESHLAWQEQEIGKMGFPLCSDFYPHGEVTEKFGILRDEPPVGGISERAAFIVDKEGVIRFAKVYPIDQLPDLPGLLAEVEKIQGK